MRTAFEKIYTTFLQSSPLLSDPTLSGYAGRRHVMLHKVAMAVSASLRSDLILNEDDYLIAHGILCQVENPMQGVTRQIAATEGGELTEEVLRFIASQGEVTRSQLIKKFSHKIKSAEMEGVITTLEQAGQVQMRVDSNKVYYGYIGEIQ